MSVRIAERRLLVDDVPVQLTAGEIHYFRIPRDGWQRRIDLAADAGCSVIATYMPWLWHELPDGSYDLNGRTRPERDLGGFIDLCAASGLRVIARPGPYIMAELKNEGLPYRLYREHPEMVGTGWDGAAVPTAAVDYLHPAFLRETERWFAQIMPVLASRLQPAGGPIIAVQLDNEIGMLPWVSNTPNFTDAALHDLHEWLHDRYGEAYAEHYPQPRDAQHWRTIVTAPDEQWAGDLRVDLMLFTRNRFGRYTSSLTDLAAQHGVRDVPLLINIHGTEGGNGVPFAIGVSQLLDTFAGIPNVIAGSDHYLGDLSTDVTCDLHFVNAVQAAVNGDDQPLTSLEFEAGTGDYGAGADRLLDPASVELKTRLFVAQGNRLINYYLLAGGINPLLPDAAGDGNGRVSFTGERHGTAAPIDPEGCPGITYAATTSAAHAVGVHAPWLADMDEEFDDLAVAFLPDAFGTEYHYPGSETMSAVVADLAAHRGPGQRKALWRSLLFAGYRFGAVNLQDPAVPLPTVVCLASGAHLDGVVQQRLVDHLRSGGRLLQLGPLPTKDLRGRKCTILIDALGVRPGETVRDGHQRFPSVLVTDRDALGLSASGRFGVTRDCTDVAELRVAWLQRIEGGGAELLRSVDGVTCGRRLDLEGGGAAILLAAELPSSSLISWAATSLGTAPGLTLGTTVPGVVALTSASPASAASGTQGRLLHLINPTGYDATIDVCLDGRDLGSGWALPARTGVMLADELELPIAAPTVLRSATAELRAVGASLTFGPSLDPGGHRVVLRTGSRVVVDPALAAVSRDDGLVTVTTADADRELTITLG